MNAIKKKNVYKVHGSTAADFPGGVREKKKISERKHQKNE